MQYPEFYGKNITVMGLGHFGGGIGAARFLVENGAHVTVTDTKSAEDLAGSISDLSDLDIRYVLGRHDLEDFVGADMVVASPAVPRDSEYLMQAKKFGVTLRTEISLFTELCQVLVCGITGSNGKTTTVSMLKSILETAGRGHWIGGNIGGSLLSEINNMGSRDIVVLELSSFQLEWLRDIQWSPYVACVLNVLPNHLDRHGTYWDYFDAKAAIFDYQKTIDFGVLVRDDKGSRDMFDHVRSNLTWVGANLDIYGFTVKDGMIVRKTNTTEPFFDLSRLSVRGEHMIVNALAAAACAWRLNIPLDVIAEGLAAYRGLPHRLEYIGERDGVSFYNDSKATTPEAAAAGVKAFDNPVCVILGGYDKQVPFDAMAKLMAGNVRHAALIGTTAPAIADVLDMVNVPYSRHDSLDDAFTTCTRKALDGDTVLLSPACASYDMFPNFEVRGDAFRRLALNHIS